MTTPKDETTTPTRAASQPRRYHALRRLTVDVLGKIRRLNRLAIAMRAGLMDTEEAAREIAAAEADLHDLVDRLRDVAGVEGDDDLLEDECDTDLDGETSDASGAVASPQAPSA